MQYCSLQHWMLLPHQTHPQLSIISALAQPLLSFWSISNCPLLFPSSIVGTFQPGRLIFHCHIFLPSHTVQGVLQARIPECVAISFFRGPHFSELFMGTQPSWVPCMVWLRASLIYASPFTMTRLWSITYICNGILLSHKKDWNVAICSNIYGSRDYHTK